MRFSILAAAMAAVCWAAGAQASTVFNANLIKNSGAESDTGGDGNAVLAPAEWATSGNITVVNYAQGADNGFPSSFPGSGENFFAGGPNSAISTAWQVADISDGAAVIDLGLTSFTLSGYLGGWLYQEDNASLTVTFQDAMNATLGSTIIGPIGASDRGAETQFVFCSTSGLVPVGTRQIEFLLQMTRRAAPYNDGYADNLSFVMAGQEIPPANAVPLPAAAWMGMSLLGGAGGMGVLRRRLEMRR